MDAKPPPSPPVTPGTILSIVRTAAGGVELNSQVGPGDTFAMLLSVAQQIGTQLGLSLQVVQTQPTSKGGILLAGPGR